MSIVEIAKETGVSCATISRVLNTPEKVSPETLARVRRACQKFNFTPRVIPNRIKTVFLAIPSPGYFLVDDNIMVANIISSLNKYHYNAIVSTLSEINNTPAIFQRAFIAIIHQGDIRSLDILRKWALKCPVVAIDGVNEGVPPETTLVRSDHRQGVSMAIEYLLKSGHQRIGYVGLDMDLLGCRERFLGYKTTMEQQGLYSERLVFLNNREVLLEGINRLGKEKISALFISESTLTLRVLYYLKLLGKDVPGDISVISSEFAGGTEFLYPPLTCIVQPLDILAELVVEKLMRRLQGEETKERREYYVPYAMVKRESVNII